MIRMQWFRENYFKDIEKGNTITVLDVGSRIVPRQVETYKIFFNEKPFKYIGLDMVEGNNVDIVLKKPYQWEEISDSFCDVLICGQVFEHIEFPWITISEIARVVKPGGLICIIAPSMSRLHRHPVNCQNYFSDGMIALAKYAGLDVIHVSTNLAPINAPIAWYGSAEDTMLVARKLGGGGAGVDLCNYRCEPADLKKMATGFIPLKEQPYFYIYNRKMNIKRRLKIIFWPIFGLRSVIRKMLKL